MWRNRVQRAIKTAKRSYYDSKVDGLAETNPNKWWQNIKPLTGQDTFGRQEWHHQLLNDTINSPALLATQVIDFFSSITHEFEPLTQIRTPPNVISLDLLVSLKEVSSDLLMLPTQRAVRPNGISNKLLKEFAPKLGVWHYRSTPIRTSWPLDCARTNLFNASYTQEYRFRELLCP